MGRSADVPRQSGTVDGDDTGCTMLHVDMDAFFASVEVRRRPELRGRPVVVGGGSRGVVAAASYEARRFGIRSAMPMTRALRLCPSAVVLPVDRDAYVDASRAVMSILRGITTQLEPLSLDEAFLDVAGAVRSQGRPVLIAQTIRRRISGELGLTCSVGIAPTKFVAKLASARCKPDGLLLVPAAEVLTFLHPLPVTVLWGVGARTAEPLHRLGIRTVGELAETPPDAVRRAVGTATAEHLLALAHGIDPRRVSDREPEKSISADHTTQLDLTEPAEVLRQLRRLADEVGSRLRERRVLARTIGIKIRFADFQTVTRVRTLAAGTDQTIGIFETAAELYRGLGLDRPRIRLVGVKCENLVDADAAAEQLSLDSLLPPPRISPVRPVSPGAGPRVPEAHDGSVRQPDTDRIVDATRARFGPASIGYGTELARRQR
jgi:DNA polymerase-4